MPEHAQCRKATNVSGADEASVKSERHLRVDFLDKPRCPHGSKSCPGTSDVAHEWVDEQCGDLIDWLCETCTFEFKLELGMPITDDEIAAERRTAIRLFAEVCRVARSEIR